MDIEMPVMDGYESSREIKFFDPEAKILVLTGNPNDTRAQRVLKEDMAFALLQKPYSLRDLGRIILENLPASSWPWSAVWGIDFPILSFRFIFSNEALTLITSGG